MVGLNVIEVSTCDIYSAYLDASVGDKVCFLPEAATGATNETVMIIIRALSALKISAKAWRLFFVISLKEMGHRSCPVEPDVYKKKECDKNVHLALHASVRV